MPLLGPAMLPPPVPESVNREVKVVRFAKYGLIISIAADRPVVLPIPT